MKDHLEMFKVDPVRTLLGWVFFIPAALFAVWFGALLLRLNALERFLWDVLWYWMPIGGADRLGWGLFIRLFLAFIYAMIAVMGFWATVDLEIEKRKRETEIKDLENDLESSKRVWPPD